MADSEDELPPERDVKDFTFKQMRKIRMFEAPQSLPTPRCNLLAVSSKYGLTFVGCLTGLKVIKTETIERIHDSDEGSMQNVVALCPSSYIDIGHIVQFVGISCDNLTLSVCYENGNNTVMVLYDVPTLGSPNNSKAKFGEITLNSDSGVSIVNLVWNPGFPGLFAVCVSSGSVLTMELTDTQVKTLATLPASLKASAICWSPKGKQLVVGHKDGRLTQYSQVLQVKKEIDCPELFTDDPHLVADVLWITSTLFAAVFSSFEEGDTPKFQLISTPKNEPVTITNFDDIYYVMSEERQPVFYMRNLSEWSLVLSACSNGLEAAVIGKYGGEAPLEKWSFEEDGRPVMPLTNDNDDTFPMGLEIDFSSTRQIAKGEDRLPPAPIMMILSTDGVLCPFYMLNQTPNVNHTIVKPPEPLPLGGQRKPVVTGMNDMSHSQATGGVGPAEKGLLQPVPVSLGTSANLPVGAFSFASAKQTIPAAPSPVLSGLSGNGTLGAFSIGSSKQMSGTFSSGTPASNAPSAFSFASPKQAVPSASGAFSGMTVGAPASAFSVTGQKPAGLMAFKPPQSQVPGAELVKPSTTPQLVKPTPTSQTQPGLAVGPGLSSFQSPGSGVNAGTAKPVAQGFSLGGDRPKAMSSTPSQVAGQGTIAQPKPTPAQPPVTVTKPPAVRLQPQSEKSASSGFKLPGQPTDTTELTRRQLTKKAAPVSNDDVIEASVSKNIREAISHFNEELVRLRESVKTMQSKCCLTNDDKDLHTLRKTTDEIGSSLAEIRVVTKDQHKDIDEEKRKLLDSFEMMEDARIRNGRKNDPRYVQLLKSRALDPMNKNKMRDIRHLHSHLDKTLREVNMVLDEQWNKENECKKSIQRPALDEIFQTLRINQKIAQDQGAKLEKITEEMENRKLLSTSWQRNSVSTSSVRDVSSMSNPFAVSKGELKSPSQRSPVPVSPEKQTQLRSMFQKRRNTPVRRSMIVPSTVTKTPTVKPSKPQVPCFSSTPAANPVAEKNKNSIRFNLSITQEEEDYYAGGEGSLPEEGEAEGDETQENEQELEQLSAVSKVSSSGPASSGAFSLSGGSTFVPAVSVSGKDVLSALAAKDDGEVKKSTAQSVRPDVAVGSQARPTSQPSATGAFSSVVKPAGSQAASATTQAEPSRPSGGLFLPGAAKLSSTTAAPSKSDLTSGVKVISTETPPNIAAAMAAMSRANATQSAVQPSSSNLDPSASIEPVTLVAYKPQGGAQTKDQDAENTAAKAIANAALMAATAEAQKHSTKPQCSTEFIFKSTDSGKPGPPVVTFKPPHSSSQTSETGFTLAPNVTVFKPAFGPVVPSSSAVSNTVGLQPSLTGTQVASPFSQVTSSSVPFSFATPPGGLFNFSPSSGTSTFGSKGGDTKTANQIPASSAATVPTAVATGTTASTTAVGITPSPRVSRNLFASGDVSSQAAPTEQQQDKSKESGVQVTTVSSSFASSTGITTAATAPFSFSAPAPSSGGFFKNLSLSSNVGSAFGSSNVGNGSTSILNALMRSSDAGNSSNLFPAVPTTVPSDAAPPPLSKATPSEKRDASTTTLSTPSSVSIPASAGGVFAQALSESSKPSVVPSASTVNTLPSTTGIFGAAVTTTASTSGGLFDLPSTTSVTAPSAIAATSNLFALSAGSPLSAFSATSTASPFFSINPASTKPSAPLGSSPSSSSTAATTSTAQGSSTSAASGLFGKVTSTTSAFGAVSTAGSSGFGSLGTAATTSAGGGLFGTSASPAFAPTSVFGTSSGGSTFGSSQAFSSPVSSQGSTFGSAPVFGSASTTAGTGSMFGASSATSKPAFGQSSFLPTTSAGFGQAASKPAENALGFGFSGFGLGGQGSSQTAAKTNPFGVAQEFSTTATSQSSLFGGKSGADIFKASNTSKPAFGSGPFSQSGFGPQSSSGFSGGSFSSQGGSVQSSGFGFGAASSIGSSSGFGSSQPFGSPSAGGSVFGGAPAFGSSPSFGAAPAFGGSPQRGLGATPSQGIFGSSGGFGQSSGSPTFGSLASQSNVPTFGSIAGQSPTPQGFGSIQPQQQHQSSPSFGSFGGGSQSPSGVSFSQWR